MGYEMAKISDIIDFNIGPLVVLREMATMTVGLETKFCPECNFRWIRPSYQITYKGALIVEWDCQICNMRVSQTRSVHGCTEMKFPIFKWDYIKLEEIFEI